jgi:divalent metal cation (Fe/Co/Zn/Cd) transporter
MSHADSNALATMLGGGCLIFGLLIAAIGIAVLVFYILTLQKALNLAGPRHQKMQPAMVWLMLIPLFNLVWHFFVVKNVSESIKSWATEKGAKVDDAGYTIGLVACIANACGLVPLVNLIAGPVGLVCMIIWWVKVAGFNKLMSAQA